MNKSNSQRKPVNLLINEDLLRRAREENINLSAALDKAIRQELLLKWREETRPAFAEHAKEIDANGLWSDGLRTW
jgi:antitoxin CcdA